MSRGVFLALALLAACSSRPAPAPPAPPLPAPSSPGEAASGAFVPVPPPPPPPRYQAAAPFVVVARAGPEVELQPMAGERGVLVAAISREQGAVRFASVEGEQARLLPGMTWNFLPGNAEGTREFQGIVEGDEGTRWITGFATGSEGIRFEFWRHAGQGWAMAGSVEPGETGLMTAAIPWGERLLVASHGSASVTPHFQVMGPGKERKVPRFTGLKKHPNGCLSQVTTVLAGRAWASGEVLVVGTSCWIPVLQIERWAPGQTRAEAREIKAIVMQEPTVVKILSPDEIVLDLVTVEPSPPENNLFRVRLLRKNGAWKIAETMTRPLPTREEPTAAMDATDARLIQTWEVGGEEYLTAQFPREGVPIENVLLRRSPVKAPVDF